MADVDMRRKEFTLRQTKNSENRTVPMTPEVYARFTALWQARRLDTSQMFLYNGKPVTKPAAAFRGRVSSGRDHQFTRFPAYGEYKPETG
jgi:integrase